MKRIALGALLGGLALFVWSMIAHLPPVGTAGLRTVARAESDTVLASMRAPMSERAIYVVGLDRLPAGPIALVAYNPGGASYGRLMAIEYVSDTIAALFGAIIAANLSGMLRYWPRVLILAAIGIVATIDIDASYWNWYAFPTAQFLAQMLDHVVGWLVAGTVLARVCPPRQKGSI